MKRVICWLAPNKIDYIVARESRHASELVSSGSVALSGDGREAALDQAFGSLKARLGSSVGQLDVIVSSEQLEHELIELPVVTRRELQQLLSRDVALRNAAGAGAGALAWSFMRLGAIVVSGIQKDRVLLGTAPDTLLQSVIAVAEDHGFKLGRVLSVPFLMQHLISFCLTTVSSGAVAVLNIEESVSHICFFNDGIFQWFREIPFGLAGVSAEATDAPRDAMPALVAEVRRSLMFYQQKFSNVAAPTLLLMGALPSESEAAEQLRQTLNLHIVPLSVRSLSKAPRRLPPQQLLTIPVLGACRSERGELPNFLPQQYFEKHSARSRVVILSSLLLLIIVLLSAGIYLTGNSAESHRRVVQSLQRSLQRFDASIDLRRATLQNLEQYQGQLSLIAGLADQGIDATDVMAGLMQAITPHTYLSRFLVQPKNRQWSVSIEGSIVGLEQAQAYAEFADLLKQLEAAAVFQQVSVHTLTPRGEGDKRQAGPQPGKVLSEREFRGIDFIIDAALEAGS